MDTPVEKLHDKWFNQFKPKLAFWYAADKLFECRGKLIMQGQSQGGNFELISNVLKANTRLTSVITAIYLEKNLPERPVENNSSELETIALILDRIDQEMNKDKLVDSLGNDLDLCNDLNVMLDILLYSSYALIRDTLESS